MFSPKNNTLSYVMWLFPLLFFTYQFILRLWPGLLVQQIMQQFSIDASQFGIIAACYYYGYAGMQIPVALLLERYGAKYIVFAFAVLCGLATFLFTYCTNWYLACFSRFLVGAGSAVGFLGVSKVVSEWFPKTQYTKMIGFSFTIGLMGAIYGGKPINLLIETYHWKQVACTLAVISIIIGFVTYLILSLKRNEEANPIKQESMKWAYFKILLSSPTMWLLAVANLLMVGSLEGFSDVWGVSYLMTAYAISKSSAASLISCVFFGMLFGGPLLAMFSKKFGNYTVISCCGFGMTLAFSLLVLNRGSSWWVLAGLLFCIGVMCCYQVIVFAAGSDLVKQEHLGVTIAFLNCINMLGGSFFHTIIGKVMDIFWSGSFNQEGIREYSITAYQCSLMFIPVCAFIGALMIVFLGIKKKQSLYNNP